MWTVPLCDWLQWSHDFRNAKIDIWWIMIFLAYDLFDIYFIDNNFEIL